MPCPRNIRDGWTSGFEPQPSGPRMAPSPPFSFSFVSRPMCALLTKRTTRVPFFFCNFHACLHTDWQKVNFSDARKVTFCLEQVCLCQFGQAIGVSTNGVWAREPSRGEQQLKTSTVLVFPHCQVKTIESIRKQRKKLIHCPSSGNTSRELFSALWQG